MVAGWGKTESGSVSSLLRYSSFTIKTNNDCGRTLKHFYYNKTVQFCASDVKGHSAPCRGDSGGSMVRKVFLNGKYRFVTIGLVSWGGCKAGNHFGYYTRLQPFLPWIYHKVNSTCIGPGQLTNGTVNSTKSIYQPNEVIRFTCNINYTRIGKSKLTCQLNGTWNGYKPICLERRCKDPGDIKFGNKQEDKRDYKVGSKITYWCFPNYEQEGNNKLICTKAGTWSSPPPKCNLPTCLKPTTPANARTRKRLKERYRFNEIIVYYCEDGHFTTGYRVRRCTIGGKWSELKLRCIPKSCGDPGTPKNGRRSGYLFTFKKKVHYQCDRGYILIGPQFRQCQSNQKWSDTPTCEPVDCGRLPTPQHGEKIGETKSTYLGEVSFRCNKRGYQLKGSSRRVCQENGKWDGTLTKCEPVECQDPGKLDYGGRYPDLDKYVYESKIEYICKTNHTLKGDKHIICQHDKTWTGTKPTCLRPCSDPGIPRGGYRLHHSFLHADKVSFACKSGWKIDDERNIECNNGNWDNDAPTCLEGCTKPRHSPNGYVSPANVFYYNGDRVSMYCDWNYKLIGDTSARCRNGKWSNKPPSCKRKCYNPGSPYNGWRNGYEFFEGKRVTFECNRGYDLVGLKTLECLDTGKWSGDVPTCKRRCAYSQPSSSKTTPIIADGVSVRHGTSIQFVCINDYTLVGQQTAVCNDGRWNPSIPVCKAPCQGPGPIANGVLFGNTFTHRSSVRYVCIKGYSLDNPAPLICNDGRWNRPVPSCKKKCDDPGTPRNAIRTTYSNNLKHGSQVLYTCNGNTELVGSRRIVCNDGKWSSPHPKCLEICQWPKGPKNGQVRVSRSKFQPLSGDKATFSCKSHYDLIGRKEIFCDKGTWNGTAPRCAGQCEVPNNIQKLQPSIVLKRGDWLQNGTKIRFQCKNQGHTFVGRKKITCKNGQWNHNFPICKVPCKDPSSFSYGTKKGDQFKQEFQCNAGYTMVGSSVINCVNGKWNDDIPKCFKNCHDLGDIPNGNITNNGFKHGDKISIRCKSGFRIKGSPELICNNGEWANRKPKCVGFCAPLGFPKNGQMLDFNFDYGSTVRFRCNYGFSLRGPENVTCNNGKWNSKVPSCKANCLDPGRPTNGERKGDLFAHLQTVSFSCKNNLTMIGSSKIQCIDGKWTARKPDCTECGSPLGMENRKIPNKNIRASSTWSNRYDVRYARLNSYSAWCSGPLNNKSPAYLEIDLKKPHRITYIATQGSSLRKHWETKYTLSHTLAMSSDIEYRENDREKVFNGNSDATTVVKHKLKKSFIARKVRFRPTGWRFPKYNFTSSCMRVEIYGCDLPTDCVMVGSRVLGRWGSNYHGGDYYYKSYVKTIDDIYDEVQLEIEDDNHNDDKFKTMPKTHVVLDVPNKQLNLPPDTRVLAPLNNKYYTGTIERKDGFFYLVLLDWKKTHKWFRKSLIRVLKPTQFCEG